MTDRELMEKALSELTVAVAAYLHASDAPQVPPYLEKAYINARLALVWEFGTTKDLVLLGKYVGRA